MLYVEPVFNRCMAITYAISPGLYFCNDCIDLIPLIRLVHVFDHIILCHVTSSSKVMPASEYCMWFAVGRN